MKALLARQVRGPIPRGGFQFSVQRPGWGNFKDRVVKQRVSRSQSDPSPRPVDELLESLSNSQEMSQQDFMDQDVQSQYRTSNFPKQQSNFKNTGQYEDRSFEPRQGGSGWFLEGIRMDNVGFPKRKIIHGGVKYYPNWRVFKSKSALTMRVTAPQWKATDKGNWAVEREGVVFLEFADSVGQRVYDWGNKTIFALSAAELGKILAEPRANHEMYHDPGKMSDREGSVVKSFKCSLAPQSGWFFSLLVKQGESKVSRSISLTPGEFRMFEIIGEYLLPRLMGFDRLFEDA